MNLFFYRKTETETLVKWSEIFSPVKGTDCWGHTVSAMCQFAKKNHKKIEAFYQDSAKLPPNSYEQLIECAKRHSPNIALLKNKVKETLDDAAYIKKLKARSNRPHVVKEIIYTNLIRLQLMENERMKFIRRLPDNASSLAQYLALEIQDVGPIMLAGQFGPFFYKQDFSMKGTFAGVNIYLAPKGSFNYSTFNTHNIIIVGVKRCPAQSRQDLIYYLDPTYDCVHLGLVKGQKFLPKLYVMSAKLLYQRLHNLASNPCYIYKDPNPQIQREATTTHVDSIEDHTLIYNAYYKTPAPFAMYVNDHDFCIF